MWIFLLLLLSLMTGCVASSKVRGCPEGWVEFTCKCPRTCDRIAVVDPRGTPKKSTQRDKWETKGSISLYHDTKNKKLKVAIKQLQREDVGKYRCKFDQYQGLKSVFYTEELHLVKERDVCRGKFIQTAYRTAKTTITCDYQGKKYESGVMFFCKENTNSICEDILSSPKSNMTFNLTENSSSFSMSISNVSSHHAGVYWCGVKSNDGSYRTALRKTQLEVEGITKFTRSPTVGQTFSYWCKYTNGSQKNKFICKGEDPSTCQRLVSTTQLERTTGKFSMDEKKKGNITITVREVTTDDAGTYWCGAESTNKTLSNPFYHRLVMTVVPPPPTSPVSSTVTTSTSAKSDVPPPTTSPVSSTFTGSTSAKSDGGPQVVIIVIVCVAVLLLLLLVLILSLIYKRFHSKNTRNGTAAQQIREDYVYEEIQEHVQRPDSGNAVNTIYATANFTTNPSATLHYSTIKFQNSSDKAGGEALILRPSSSACEYSTVKNSPSPTYYTVNEPSTSSHNPLYSTVNKPR